MAHEITDRDGMVLYGKPAWHGLGKVVDKAPTPAEALQIAGLDWDIESVPLIGKRSRVTLGDDNVPVMVRQDIAVESHVANVRGDTGEVLGVVGSGYSVVQNRDLVPLIYDAAGAEGVTIESAGSLRAGRDVFFLAHLDTFNIGERDKSHTFALFLNSHAGTSALKVLPTSIRVVCANTRRAALSAADAKALTVNMRHTSGMPARMEDVRASLRGAKALAAREADIARALAARTMTPEEVRDFFAGTYRRLYGDLPRDPATAGDKAKVTRAREMTRTWWETLRAERDTLGVAPSAWLAANAVTEWIDHKRTVRGGDRLASNLDGSGADAKDDVFAGALALIGK